jgi:hypothetical protein
MMSSSRGDELVRRIIANPGSAQEFANDLPIELNRGYAVTALASLLRHSDHDVVEAGIWLASEMPGRLGALAEQTAALVEHERPDVRFFAIDVVLDNINENGALLAAALLLVDDGHRGVRWKAMRFAALADETQLRAAASSLSEHHLAALRASGLLAHDPTADREEIAGTSLRSSEKLLRCWSAATAARLGSVALLEEASRSDDDDVATFASRELSRLRRFGPARTGGDASI